MKESLNSLDDLYDKIEEALESKKFRVFDFKKISYGIQFKISDENNVGLLRIYQNKKNMIKFDFSQIKNEFFKQDIQSLLLELNFAVLPKRKDFGFPIIGTDEAGKGDYFGPLVSVGICIQNNKIAEKLSILGVRDSKNLKDNQNLELAKKIKNISRNFSIVEISPYRYNQLYSQFKSENKNLNTLLAWSHAKAIEDLLSRTECNKAVVDQFANETYLIEKLQEKGRKIEIIQVHKAEENIAVAAASILARARFLEELAKLSDEYKINFPKGASNQVIEIAKEFVEKYGKEKLSLVAKIHFKTTELL
ncbi:MAG: ribonuclease HIII [Candidatus Helarchaeota archaeon]